jgi:hypothetical protein
MTRPRGVSRLIEILSWARPHGSPEVEQFCTLFLDPIPGMYADTFSNRIVAIGAAPRVMWSCHVDTVHSKGGRQNVQWDGNILRLANGKPGQCLGADDGAGVWLMLEMIAAARPGLYVFHQGEEKGCLGSRHILHNTPELLDGLDAAIALDRAGCRDVITHQMGARCASDSYGEGLARALNRTAGLDYRTDDGGVFTDTEVYREVVPECINLSVGYQGQHGPRESLDVAHLVLLRDALLVLDTGTLAPSRDPAADDFDDFNGSRSGYARFCSVDDDGYDQWARSWRMDTALGATDTADINEGREMLDLVMDNPNIAVELLRACGITSDDLFDAVLGAPARARGHGFDN